MIGAPLHDRYTACDARMPTSARATAITREYFAMEYCSCDCVVSNSVNDDRPPHFGTPAPRSLSPADADPPFEHFASFAHWYGLAINKLAAGTTNFSHRQFFRDDQFVQHAVPTE